MEASKSAGSVKAQLIITTDKTYANINKVEGYKEDEPLGVGGTATLIQVLKLLLTLLPKLRYIIQIIMCQPRLQEVVM